MAARATGSSGPPQMAASNLTAYIPTTTQGCKKELITLRDKVDTLYQFVRWDGFAYTTLPESDGRDRRFAAGKLYEIQEEFIKAAAVKDALKSIAEHVSVDVTGKDPQQLAQEVQDQWNRQSNIFQEECENIVTERMETLRNKIAQAPYMKEGENVNLCIQVPMLIAKYEKALKDLEAAKAEQEKDRAQAQTATASATELEGQVQRLQDELRAEQEKTTKAESKATESEQSVQETSRRIRAYDKMLRDVMQAAGSPIQEEGTAPEFSVQVDNFLRYYFPQKIADIQSASERLQACNTSLRQMAQASGAEVSDDSSLEQVAAAVSTRITNLNSEIAGFQQRAKQAEEELEGVREQQRKKSETDQQTSDAANTEAAETLNACRFNLQACQTQVNDLIKDLKRENILAEDDDSLHTVTSKVGQLNKSLIAAQKKIDGWDANVRDLVRTLETHEIIKKGEKVLFADVRHKIVELHTGVVEAREQVKIADQAKETAEETTEQLQQEKASLTTRSNHLQHELSERNIQIREIISAAGEMFPYIEDNQISEMTKGFIHRLQNFRDGFFNGLKELGITPASQSSFAYSKAAITKIKNMNTLVASIKEAAELSKDLKTEELVPALRDKFEHVSTTDSSASSVALRVEWIGESAERSARLFTTICGNASLAR